MNNHPESYIYIWIFRSIKSHIMLVYWKSHGKHVDNQSGSIPRDFNQPTPEKKHRNTPCQLSWWNRGTWVETTKKMDGTTVNWCFLTGNYWIINQYYSIFYWFLNLLRDISENCELMNDKKQCLFWLLNILKHTEPSFYMILYDMKTRFMMVNSISMIGKNTDGNISL